MSRVITFSRVFQSTHPRKGEPTFFVEKTLNSFLMSGYSTYQPDIPINFLESLSENYFLPKHHTIRAGNRWKVGDKFSPRVWSGKPYQSKQITIAPDIEIKKIWNIVIMNTSTWFSVDIEGNPYDNWTLLAQNDGLSLDDMIDWFKKGNIFQGQILCWNESINY